ncbi:uncharacterized protein LOC123551568 [Mercenaria mercenaria]|uniref:uncharacterized protein LOC123551568 n=1 Tax=Mercenaria mercenaria TaxID=6596 RepID=UPI001E1D597A|nr:uncharacterized protein LOC123551568 [Mercenaria mercenaria]
MKICVLLVTAFLCFQTTYSFAETDNIMDCHMGKCKSVKPNRRVRILKDLVRNFNLEPTVIDITLKTLHNRKYGTFGEYVEEDSQEHDIPKIVCPKSEHNNDMLACPTPDTWKRIHCIDYYSLCDRKINCPNGEDEDPIMCLFHSATDMKIKNIMETMYKLYRKSQERQPYF